MDLDDLADLDGPSKANTRTTKFAPKSSKFAPKLKPASKPKTEPSTKPEPHDAAPKTQSLPTVVPVAKNKEIDEEDLKPPVVVAEPIADQPVSNGAVKMEIDGETKEDEILSEANRDEDREEEEEGDMVVREIDVFFTPSVGADTQLYVLQYPLRPCWRPYELDGRCKEVRVKPTSGEMEIDMSVEDDSNNFDKDSNNKLKMTKQALYSSWLPPRPTAYTPAVGVLMGDKLHLNPIHTVVQLRPYLDHLKSKASNKKNTVAADAELTVKVEPNDGKTAGPSTKQNKKRQSSTEQKEEDEECWVPLKYHSVESAFSAQYLHGMMAEQSCPIEFTMGQHDYVDSFCPLPSNNNKAQGPSKTYGYVSSSRRLLRSLPLEERLKKLLTEGPPFHRFRALKSFAQDHPDEEIFEVLQKLAVLVQGLWVLRSSLLFPENPSKSLPRDFVLLLFSKNPLISSAELKDLSPSCKAEVQGVLKILATERSTFKDWKIKEDTDKDFIKKYPDIVEKQRQNWVKGEGNVLKHIRGAKGGPSRTKPDIGGKPVKTVNSDKVAQKVAPGAQAERSMSDEIREAIPKALKKVFQTYKVCSLQLIRKGLRDLALSTSTLPKANATPVVKAAYGADAPEHELREVVSQVAVELPEGLFAMKSSQENPEYNPLREVVINLLRVKTKLKKQDVEAAAQLSLKKKISSNEYNKVMNEYCEFKSNVWVLKSGDGKPS